MKNLIFWVTSPVSLTTFMVSEHTSQVSFYVVEAENEERAIQKLSFLDDGQRYWAKRDNLTEHKILVETDVKND
jgi:hypothetical protein